MLERSLTDLPIARLARFPRIHEGRCCYCSNRASLVHRVALRFLRLLVSLILLRLIGLPVQTGTFAQDGHSSESFPVRVGVARGPHFAGQGFELAVGVVAGDERPKVELPRIAGARAWLIGTELKPIATSGIGAVVAQQNLFLSRFRVVASRPGTLEIPPIPAQIDGRSGRSQPTRLEIQAVPLEGRPAEFLGGVGQFTLRAAAVPSVIRFGQELKYRITVTGPAAWGMTAGPDLARLQSLGAGLRVGQERDETTNEPPSRTFVYHIRPARAGEIILPPVAIAAFDAAIKRYVTRVTSSVSVRIVEVPSFNPATIEDLQSPAGTARSQWVEWTAWSLSAVLLCGASVALARVRRRWRAEPRHGPAAARAFAVRLARTLARASGYPGQDESSCRDLAARAGASGYRCWVAAHRISEDLTRYLELGAGRPPGALTPIEARQGVAAVTGSDDLGGQAERLAAHCDLALYGERNGESSASDLLESARQLFQALGQVKISRQRGLEEPHRELAS
jgi:hypothetical protein